MVLISEIENAYNSQKYTQLLNQGVSRILSKMPGETMHIDIITGIRRCGKSTFMRQLAAQKDKLAFFNFEDPRIFGFDMDDFPKLLQVMGNDINFYFFDEIQNIKGWEIFIRNLHDQGKKIFITGSNASLLSRELGTHLTGRQLSHEMFPFSFNEFLTFKNLSSSYESFNLYFENGGFPEYLSYPSVEILQQLFKDIIYRDIAVRYGVRNVNSLVDIALHLISGSGKEYTLNKLKNTFQIGSANSVAEYVNWFEDSYLIFSVPMFSWSSKVKNVNPKKVYTIDPAFARANSLSYTNDYGRLLENMVYLQLRRAGLEINYFKNKGECDFVTFKQREFNEAFQVCYELNLDNKNREISGLVEALQYFEKKKGTILTMNQEDTVRISDIEISVVPVWKWLIDF